MVCVCAWAWDPSQAKFFFLIQSLLKWSIAPREFYQIDMLIRHIDMMGEGPDHSLILVLLFRQFFFSGKKISSIA